VGKAVSALRKQGFEIQAQPRVGYRLVSEPDMILPARVEARLEPDSLGLPYFHFEDIDSTNLEARRRAEKGAPHGALLATEYQSMGRGRLQRRWIAPSGACLMFSLILRPDLELGMVFGLTNLAALAVCRALENITGLEPKIKWPNDLYLNGVKLAGVLTEFASRAEQVEYVVVGVGLNVNLTPLDLKDIGSPATSLFSETGRKWDRARILAAVMGNMKDLYKTFTHGDKKALVAEYEARSWLLGKEVSVRDGDEVKTGVFKGMAADGALILQNRTEEMLIRHGDVTVLSVSDKNTP
jgi:BirA family biotin operon repressor/biotin-[acetyl-CoA-carboxylase] ligase